MDYDVPSKPFHHAFVASGDADAAEVAKRMFDYGLHLVYRLERVDVGLGDRRPDDVAQTQIRRFEDVQTRSG